MATTVYLHVGLPKTGTTYLQTILWKNRDELRRQGILLPGFGPRQHLWASGVVREEPNLANRHADAPRAWDQLTDEVNAWPGTAVISHEFFAGASPEQVARAVAAFAGAEVHVVVTARDTVSLVTARWQEYVKNGATTPIDGYPEGEETSPHDAWDWGSLDVADVLRRWSTAVPPARVHVLTLPKPTEPRETLWVRFAALLGIDADRCDASGSEANESLGVVEVELLRRVNADLQGFGRPLDRGVWIRGYLAQGKLVPPQGREVLAVAGAGGGAAGPRRPGRRRARGPRLRRDRRPRRPAHALRRAGAASPRLRHRRRAGRRGVGDDRGDDDRRAPADQREAPCRQGPAGPCEKGRRPGACFVAPFTDPLTPRGPYSGDAVTPALRTERTSHGPPV